MSKYHDDNTYATNPGGIHLSEAKLRELEPELFENRTLKCSTSCDKDHPTWELRERYAEHLMLGDSRAAVVVSTNPLLVAALSHDIDTAVLLRFPAFLVPRYGLQVGTRLLTVNTYEDRKGIKTGARFYASDLIPGPDRSGWSNYFPFIAEFLSDDVEQIQARKRAIGEEEWALLDRHARTRIDRLGAHTARSGKPTQAGSPVLIGGAAPFQPIEAFSRPRGSLYKVEAKPASNGNRAIIAAVIVSVLAFLLLMALR